MAESDVIREFLVKLGFEVDEGGLRRFTMGLLGATRVAVELGGAVIGAATGVVAAVTKMSEAGEQLYFIAQRTHAAAANIQAFGFAVSQMGGTVEGARSSLEGLAEFLRSSPGAGSLLQSLGVNPNQDPTKILEQLGQRFRQMPLYRAQMYAGMFGIDQKTMFALIAGVGQFSQVYQDMLQKAGVNSTAATAASHGFMVEIRNLGAAFSILGQKVNLSLAKGMTNDIKAFRLFIVDNFTVITSFILMVTKGILAAADATILLIRSASQGFQALSGWFESLPASTQAIIKEFGLLLIAWRVLNMGFLASPLGIILSLAMAILLLWQDYQTWKAGGKSLIDWSKWAPDIQRALAAIGYIWQGLNRLVLMLGGWQIIFEAFATYLATRWIMSIGATLGKAALEMLSFGGIAEGVLGAGAGGLLGTMIALGAALTVLISKSNAAGAASVPGLSPQQQSEMLLEGGNPNLFPDDPALSANNGWGRLPGLWRRLRGWVGGNSNKTIAPISGPQTAQQRAFLETLGQGEGGNDYGALFGGGHTNDLSQFPQWSGVQTAGGMTHAAGRYQFEPETWARAAAALGLTDFSPASQDRAALWIAQQDYNARTGRNLNADLQSTDPMVISKVFQQLHSTWPSLFGNYGQVKTFAERLKADSAPPTPANTNTPSITHPSFGRQHGLPDPGYSPNIAGPTTPSHHVIQNNNIVQTNNITVHGANDPQGTARVIKAAQQRYHSGLIRNLPSRLI
jgi:muramidase (phage lysozyme)